MPQQTDEPQEVARTPSRPSRFKPGQSGNPRGRPKKKSPSIKTDLSRIIQEKIGVTKGGRQEKITRGAAMLHAIFSKALNGDVRAATAIMTLMLRLEPKEAEHAVPDAPLSKEDNEIVADFLRRHGASNDPTI
jgi:hypothetical protein